MHNLIKLGPYKGLVIPLDIFTEEDLNLGALEAVKKMANQWAKIHIPATYEDEVVINLRAESDKLFVPELSQANYTFTLGDPSIYKEFNQLIGHKAGDELQLVLDLPLGFPVERMRGKRVNFYITLLKVIRKGPLELTNEIACQIDPEAGSLERLKNKLKVIISDSWLHTISDARLKAILNTISSASVYELDQQELKAVSARIFSEKQKQLFTSADPQVLEALFSCDDRSLHRESLLLAEEDLLKELILNEIARIESIQVEPSKFWEAREMLLKFAGSEQNLREIFPTDDSLHQHLLQEKVLDCLWEWNGGTDLPVIGRL